MELKDIGYRLAELGGEVATTIAHGDTWVRPGTYSRWVDQFDADIRLFNSETGRSLKLYGINDEDTSTTGKTVRSVAVEKLKKSIEKAKIEIESTAKQKEDEALMKKMKPRSGFKCFKIGHECPHDTTIKESQFFVGMPFGNSHKDSFDYGIKTVLDSAGFECYKADEQCTNIDIMCKICQAIQKSKYVIINISALNPNVMFELGLAYGLGKEVFIIKDKSTVVSTDLKGLEYTEYSHAGELQQELRKKLKAFDLI